MRGRLENKLSMALATEQVLSDNASLWNNIPAMVTAVVALGTKIAEIHGVRHVQEQDTRGVAIDKDAKKQEAINAAMPVIGGLKAFSKASGDNTLLKRIDYSRSDLLLSRDTILVDRLKIVRDEANNNIGALPSFNITSAEINALSAAIAAYELMLPKTRVALNVRKNATEALDRLFQEIDLPLEIIDGIVETMEQTQPAFFQTYDNARNIVNSSNGGNGVKGTVTDKLTGAPLEGVLITINAPVHKIRANARNATRTNTTSTNHGGIYEMRKLRAGEYTLTMEREGYNKLTVQVKIENGKIAEGNGSLERAVISSAA